MGRVFFVLAVTTAVMIPSVARAQVSLWLQKGTSGYGVGAGITGSDGEITLIGQGGYSYQGFLELNIGVGWSHLDDELLGGLDGLATSTLVQFHPLKQTKELPISLEVGASYNYVMVFNETLDALGLSLTGQSLALSGGAYRFFSLGKRVGVSPEITLGWIYRRTTITDGQEEETATRNDFRVLFGANFGYLDSSGHIWGVAPALSVGTSSAIFGLFLTFVGTKS